MSGEYKSKHYGRVYVRRNCVIDGRETNPDLPATQDSLNDPSPMINGEGDINERYQDGPHEEMITEHEAGCEQKAPYPINKYVSYIKVNKNFKWLMMLYRDVWLILNVI